MSKRNRKVVEEAKKIYGTKCINCGSEEYIEYHHVVPLKDGGNDIPTNIVPLCCKCHLKASNKSTHGEGMEKAKREGRIGRKPSKTYEEWLPWLELYFNNEIGTKEFKEKVGLAEGYKLASHKFIKRYRNENNISGYFRNTVDILAAQEQRVETRRKNHQEIQDKMYEKGI